MGSKLKALGESIAGAAVVYGMTHYFKDVHPGVLWTAYGAYAGLLLYGLKKAVRNSEYFNLWVHIAKYRGQAIHLPERVIALETFADAVIKGLTLKHFINGQVPLANAAQSYLSATFSYGSSYSRIANMILHGLHGLFLYHYGVVGVGIAMGLGLLNRLAQLHIINNEIKKVSKRLTHSIFTFLYQQGVKDADFGIGKVLDHPSEENLERLHQQILHRIWGLDEKDEKLGRKARELYYLRNPNQEKGF
ncbi:MAG: hypothetical protein GXN92_02645 [Candidatus Micrarchaeota archaeon]|nr:hypothetical protein [Candidatus Micrarchaeota archaeon]